MCPQSSSSLRADVIFYFKERCLSGFRGHGVRVATEAAQSDQDQLRKLACEGMLLPKVPAGCNDGEQPRSRGTRGRKDDQKPEGGRAAENSSRQPEQGRGR